ncbi:uncharacterized protein C8Q71DRAFT_858110 [Rhodofomes roseus]|uniref:Aminoglycoside phosphotransferase domain-containing protein n=1 Tax=Rhodofomes roseus TaxID=34475 RepID=A0ABQ8KEG1_9APHY|nr:uncharacterized protein C8Q71DRAFT_858110 [Rhodofomes roseus]KAH9836097.1 hypothetical protein C8Q71DRAFT_858110 [Rhodofomes roseus]
MHILPNGSRVMSATRLLVLDGQRVLKMYPPLVDVQSIVDNMRLASGILPVARVHEFGRSGNCGYILMDFIQGHVLATVFHQYGAHAAAIVEPQILEISRRLSSIGLAHNDLEDRNIIVDDEWRIVGIIDWDFSAPAVRSTDYRYRLDPYSVSVQRWSYAFLRDCDGFGASLDANPVGGTSKLGRYGQPLIDTARLGVVPLSQRVIRPWSDFLQTLYPWPDAFRVALVLFDSEHILLPFLQRDPEATPKIRLCAVVTGCRPLSPSVRSQLHPQSLVVEAFLGLDHRTTREMFIPRVASTKPDAILIVGSRSQSIRNLVRDIASVPYSLAGPDLPPGQKPRRPRPQALYLSSSIRSLADGKTHDVVSALEEYSHNPAVPSNLELRVRVRALFPSRPNDTPTFFSENKRLDIPSGLQAASLRGALQDQVHAIEAGGVLALMEHGAEHR